MAISAFAPASGSFVSAGPTSQAVAVPGGSPGAVIVTNVGASMIYVTLGTSSAVVANNAGHPVLPGTQAALALGSNTYVAVLALAKNSPVNLTFGT